MKEHKAYRVFVEVCRIVLAATFIFSGFVKSVDPWGFAIKIGEYLTAFDMEWLYGWRFVLSIWITGAEMMLGCMVLFRVRLRITALFIFIAMTFFTLLTLGLAIWNPVEDCGCFGDAIKLSNWGTFVKNLILWPMSFLVFAGSRRLPLRPSWGDAAYMTTFAAIAFGIGIYSYYHLPLIDFLPYKKGVNLREEVRKPVEEQEVESVVVVRDRATGKKRKFDIADPAWYDESRWEYLDTKNTRVRTRVHPSVHDFAVSGATGEMVTDSILDDPGTVCMICASSFADVEPECRRRLEAAVGRAREQGARVLCLTSERIDGATVLRLGGQTVECCNMDASTLKTMLRARVGVVVVRDGVIVDKKNCTDI
jgi:triosephosphate isomerase